MKKNYFLLAFLMLFALVIKGNAQTYSLKDLSATDFAAGGGTYWSFEQYDVATGVYTPFTTYGTAGRMNYFDRYNTERYAAYTIMANPANLGGMYEVTRNGWYTMAADYTYVARDYENGTANVNLEYWTSIPDSLRGYEVYSSPVAVGQAFRNSAITFTVPADGYYKVDMGVLRQDNVRADPMTVYQRFRYSGETTVADISHLNQSFTYGIGNPTIKATPMESPVQKATWTDAQKPVHKYFYVYAKQNDKISFEADARSTNNPESSSVRGAYARTKWTNLTLTVVPEATAKAEPAKFQDPYNADLTLKAKLDSLMTVANNFIDSYDVNVYPQSSLDALSSTYSTISASYSSIQPLQYPGVITQLETAIAAYKATSLSVGDFTALSSLINQYTTFLASAVIGNQFGQYVQVSKDEFNDAIMVAQNMVTANVAAQSVINAEIPILTAAYNKFLASANKGMNTLAEGEYFFKVNDSYVNNPGTTLAANGQIPSVANEGIKANRIIDNAGEIFKLSFVTSLSPARYSIFSTLDEAGVKRHITETCVFQSTWGTPGDDNWRTFNIFNNGTACAIQCFGAAANKGYWTYDATANKLADSNNGTNAQYLFNFIPVKTVFTEEVANGRTKFNSAVVGDASGQYSSSVYNAFKTVLETAEATVTAANGTSADLITYGTAYKLFLANGETALNDLSNTSIKVIAGKNTIRITTDEVVNVTVFNATGSIVSQSRVSSDASIKVNQGLYIVKVNNHVVKVVVR